MAANPQPYFSIEQYHAMMEAEGPILEYWDHEIVLMSGGSREHLLITKRIYDSLRAAIAGGPCDAFGEGTPVDTPSLATFRLPDCMVVCGPPIFKTVEGTSISVITNPVLIVEVLSPTSAEYDRGRKFEAYKAIPTFREYLLVEQTEQFVTHWRKVDGLWTGRPVSEGMLSLESIGCEFAVANLYDGVYPPET